MEPASNGDLWSSSWEPYFRDGAPLSGRHRKDEVLRFAWKASSLSPDESDSSSRPVYCFTESRKHKHSCTDNDFQVKSGVARGCLSPLSIL